MLKNVCVLISIISLFSCTQKEFKSVDELNAFLIDEENGFTKSSVMANDIKMSMANRPTDFWVYQEVGSSPSTESELDSLRKRYGQYYYFVLSMSRNEREALHQTGDYGLYSDLLQTLSFRMAEFVTLTTSDSDSVELKDFRMDRTFGMANSTDVLLVFDRKETKETEWIQVNINEFGMRAGNQRFRFNTTILNDEPTLLFERIDKSNEP